MKKIAYFAGGIAVAASMATIAGSFTAPNTFTSGTTISSADMNANFDAVKTAVDDNDARITTLETGNSCPSDMVAVGPICVDKYEASVWDAATGGNLTTDLTTACNANGNDCSGIYARSVGGQTPATNITWFQAQQACANVGKRLLTNAEWQMAAAGTSDATDATKVCNIGSGTVADTDANPSCSSNWGVINMVGNVHEWVADWVPGSAAHASNSTGAAYGTDLVISESAASTTNNFPAAVYRGGGNGGDGTAAGVFAYNSNEGPDGAFGGVGFRCAK